MIITTGFAILIPCFIAGSFQSENKCRQFSDSCENCLASGHDCAWNSLANLRVNENGSYSRCEPVESFDTSYSSSSIIHFRSHINIPEEQGVSSNVSSMIYPRNVTVYLKPNDPVNFTFSFRQSKDYPLDLYFLMDLSHSMSDDKDKLSKLGMSLAKEMRRITQDFQLGFGSFVDKRRMPFVSVGQRSFASNRINGNVIGFLSNPCPLNYIQRNSCIETYTYKHHLSLTHDAAEFEKQVHEALVSGNIDSPEGGLEALMQAAVCQDIIGWRKNSRKIIVFSSDAGLHYAGDGLLGGLIEPNDEKCHLVRSYDKHARRYVYQNDYSELQDYPSIGQINSKLIKHNIHVIFAVTQNQKYLYEQLALLFEGAVVGELNSDSSNIVDLIALNYKKITSRVNFVISQFNSDDMNTSGVNIRLIPDCRSETSLSDDRCKINVGGSVQFTASVVMTKCAKPSTFKIFPYGLLSETLVINVHTKCLCDCEPAEKNESLSRCGGHGLFRCGICYCEENYYGDSCECDGKNETVDYQIQKCKRPGSNIVCSGRGQCVCGKCKCHTRDHEEKISGEHCECDNFSCPRHNGRICSGPTHGICQCNGTCSCLPGWSGTDCSCTSSVLTCIANSSGLICNGQGICECGKCICNKSSEFLSFMCEDCPTCHLGCADTMECVRCRAFKTGKYSSKECEACPYLFEFVDTLKEEGVNQRLCQFTDVDSCRFYYTYHYDENQRIILRVQKKKHCPFISPFWLLPTAISFFVLIVGAFTLIVWRFLVSFQDKKEVAEFERQRSDATWEKTGNPIYRQASVSYPNPMYRGKSSQRRENLF